MKRILKVSLFIAVLFALIFGATFILFEGYTVAQCVYKTFQVLGVTALMTLIYYVLIEFALWCFLD
jgi:hypothetical protein